MSNFDRQYSNGTYYTHWYGRIVYTLDYQSTGPNTSHVSLYLQTFSDNGAYSQSGTWDPRLYINGGQVAGSTLSRTISNSPSTLTSWGGDLSHDANGNLSITIGQYINAPTNEMTYGAITWNFPRIPLAPTISDVSVTPGTINTTTAQLRGEISSYGHGTSATWKMYYRLQGSGSWTSAGTQADGAGYNYWDLTGLQPGKTYEYYAAVWNNNSAEGGSDSVNSSTYTFTTKPVSGMAPLLMGLLN